MPARTPPPDPAPAAAPLDAPRAPRRVRRFLAILAPLLAVATIVVGLAVATRWEAARAVLERRLTEGATAASALIDADARAVLGTLGIVAGDDAVDESLARVPGARSRLAQLFARVERSTRMFGRLELLDAGGRERVRVDFIDGEPRIVADALLQDRSDSASFAAARALTPGAIHVSPFELDTAHGVLVRPFRPVIRVAVPIHDTEGRLAGVLVASYLGQLVIDGIDGRVGAEDADGHLVSADGYWLHTDDVDREWLSQRQPGSEPSFARDLPDVWAAMTARPNGRFTDGTGMYVYTQVRPLDRLIADGTLESSAALAGDPLRWWVVAHADREAVAAAFFAAVTPTFALAAVFLLIIVAGAWTMAGTQTRRAVAEAARDREHELTETLLRTLPIAAWIKDGRGRYAMVNPAMERFHGRAADVMVGRRADEVFPGMWTVDAARHEAEIVSGTAASAQEMRVPNADGVVRDLLVTRAPVDLGAAGRGIVGTFMDVTEQKLLEGVLRAQATRDPLTGLANRAQVESLLAALDGTGASRPVAVAMIDLDGLKTVNDTLGHAAGDEILRAAGSILRATARQTDVVARLGGDEFMVLMPGSDERAGRLLVDRVRRRLAGDGAVVHVDGAEVRVAMSIGVATAGPGESVADAMARADARMYRQKRMLPGRARREAGPSRALVTPSPPPSADAAAG